MATLEWFTNFYAVFVKSTPIFIEATSLTLRLTVAALGVGIVIGLVIALMKISGRRALNGAANAYITVIRGTPLIVQIFWIYYGLAPILDVPAFWAASLALAVHNGAYIAEIFRGGIQSVNRGQMEAARSLGMNFGLAMRRIVLPQAFKRSIPPLGNQFIIGLKDSSLAAFVTMPELFQMAMRRAASQPGNALEYYTISGIYYLALVVIFSLLVHQLERRLDVDK